MGLVRVSTYIVILYRAIWGTSMGYNVAEGGGTMGRKWGSNPGQLHTTLDAITTIPWSHVRIKLFPDVDHILKKYWLIYSYNVSFLIVIT